MVIYLISAVIILLLILFLINFYRDPKRKIPSGNNIVSPADGKVIRILNINQGRIKINKGLIGKIQTTAKDIAGECFVISIFMSPLDVHINRAPVDGTVVSVRHEKGRFFAAYNLEKSLNNEKNEVVIKNREIGKIKVIQIAGFLARRIICNVKKNEKVNKGGKIGKIVLGSQVTLIMPSKNIRLRVSINQKVKAGSTIIADLT